MNRNSHPANDVTTSGLIK